VKPVEAAPQYVSPYEEYYGLLAHPFSLTPDLRFVYPSRSHSQALEQVSDALKRREGLIIITGEIGTGKTVLCRAFLETLEPRTFLSVILDPRLSVDDLLQQVLADFGLISLGDPQSRPSAVDRHQLVSTLQRFLATLMSVGAHAVIMIDEAQHLDPTVLEEIRLLSNFETDDAKLLQIVLVGQPNLDEVLRRPDMRQLSQRVARRFELHPLSPDEVQDYIERRLSVALDAEGGRAAELLERVQLTPGAARAVAEISGGIPRIINTVCDQALEIGFERQTRTIDRRAVLAAARRLKLSAPARFGLPPGASLPAAAALFLTTAALGGWWLWSQGLLQSPAPTEQVTPIAARAATPARAASDAPSAQPAPPPDATPREPLALPAATVKPAIAVTNASYEISVAAFRTAQRAEEVADAIAHQGLPVSTRTDPAGVWHRIVVGPLGSSDEAESAQRALVRQGFPDTKISASASGGR
jgi:general secretion pathway protein A